MGGGLAAPRVRRNRCDGMVAPVYQSARACWMLVPALAALPCIRNSSDRVHSLDLPKQDSRPPSFSFGSSASRSGSAGPDPASATSEKSGWRQGTGTIVQSGTRSRAAPTAGSSRTLPA